MPSPGFALLVLMELLSSRSTLVPAGTMKILAVGVEAGAGAAWAVAGADEGAGAAASGAAWFCAGADGAAVGLAGEVLWAVAARDPASKNAVRVTRLVIIGGLRESLPSLCLKCGSAD